MTYKFFKRIAAVLYFTLLLYIVFFIKRRIGNLDYRSFLNFKPFHEKVEHVKTFNWKELLLQKDFFMDTFGNIFMFIPFTFAMFWLFQKNYSNSKILLIILLTSLTIEILQFLFNKGVSDIDDVILNSIGGILGLVVFRKTIQLNQAN